MNSIIDNIIHSGDEAFDLWPGELSQKDLNIIALKLQQFEYSKYIGKELDIITYLSIAIALLDDLLILLKSKVKKQTIKILLISLVRALKYYDRKLDKFELYDQANIAVKYWYSLKD